MWSRVCAVSAQYPHSPSYSANSAALSYGRDGFPRLRARRREDLTAAWSGSRHFVRSRTAAFSGFCRRHSRLAARNFAGSAARYAFHHSRAHSGQRPLAGLLWPARQSLTKACRPVTLRGVANGVFRTCESWKCKECRRLQPAGTLVVIRDPWFGCEPCAGVFLTLVQPNLQAEEKQGS